MLTHPGILKKYLPSPAPYLLETFQPMYTLSPSTIPQTLQHHLNLVLKPQREGGGNNVYHSSIPSFLKELKEEDMEAWIVMELIKVRQDVGAYLVRSGEQPIKTDVVVSELGIFGWCLFRRSEYGKAGVQGEKTVGWLVRTKGKESDEGGVASGFSVLDSLFLVD